MLSCTSVGEGAPLVVLPAYGLDHVAMAASYEPGLAARSGVRRVYMDLPGTGASPAVGPSSDAVLAAVEESLEKLAGGGPVLVSGWSYGGYLALGLARRRPDLVAAMFLVCTGVLIGPADRDVSGTAVAEPELLQHRPNTR